MIELAVGALFGGAWSQWAVPKYRSWIGLPSTPRPSLPWAAYGVVAGTINIVLLGTPFFGGFCYAMGFYEFWNWWNHDDRKPLRDRVRNKVRWQVFMPSPIPALGSR